MKLNYLFLALIIFLLCANMFESCNKGKQTEKYYNQQQLKLDSLKSEVRKKTANRVDTLKIIERHLTILDKEKTEQTNEVYNTNNINDVIALYIRHRPDTTGTN